MELQIRTIENSSIPRKHNLSSQFLLNPPMLQWSSKSGLYHPHKYSKLIDGWKLLGPPAWGHVCIDGETMTTTRNFPFTRTRSSSPNLRVVTLKNNQERPNCRKLIHSQDVWWKGVEPWRYDTLLAVQLAFNSFDTIIYVAHPPKEPLQFVMFCKYFQVIKLSVKDL